MNEQQPLKKRKLRDWIDAFVEFTDDLPTSLMFRRWSAISIIAGALERKTWTFTAGSDLHPNLYILLVSQPGMGKTVLIKRIQEFWGELNQHKLSPTNMSRASLIDTLMSNQRETFDHKTQTPHVFNSLLIGSNELSTLIPVYDSDFMGTLTDLYDGDRYDERKRTKDVSNAMKKTHINMIAGTTPSFLSDIMPTGAWDQGFASRMIIVYSGEKTLVELFTEEDLKKKPHVELTYDLQIVGALIGKMNFTDEAKVVIDKWYRAGAPPIPKHPRLASYISRRVAHCLKLCQVACASRGNDLLITVEDFKRAKEWLLHAEAIMPDAFRAMEKGVNKDVMQDCTFFIINAYEKNNQPISDDRIWNYLLQRMPPEKIEPMLRGMVNGGILERLVGAYKPRIKKE